MHDGLNPVCILTAGRGTRMGALAPVINKCLLPYQGKAMISHIIASFPKGTPFVIALGYKSQQVRDYLSIAHPDLRVQFIVVDQYEGPGTGPGYSLLCCKPLLNRPFYFIACDTLIEWHFTKIAHLHCNWVGVSKVAKKDQADYCNIIVSHQRVTGIVDKQKVTKGPSYAFTGLMYIQDDALFWSAFEKECFIAGERQISQGLLGLVQHSTLQAVTVKWLDLGTYEKYRKAVEATEAYDFGKTNEFLYFMNQQVIKFFSDEAIINGRAKKAALKPDVFPCLSEVKQQWYSYDFVPGETLYVKNNPPLFDKLLLWLEQALWSPVQSVSSDDMRTLCQKFYRDKTQARLMDYDKKYADVLAYRSVNGQPIESVQNIMRDMPWEELYSGVPTFIHGDLQFDNILYDEASARFILLDWRQDFGGETRFGDIYYDLAKLMGGIILNYDYIKAGLFQLVENGSDLTIDFAQRFTGNYYLDSLRKWVQRRELDFRRVQLLLGLIYLNMSPLHHPPFDKVLHALGCLILTDVLYGKTPSLVFNAKRSERILTC